MTVSGTIKIINTNATSADAPAKKIYRHLLNSNFLTTYRAWNCKETGVAEALPESAAEDDYQERENVAP